MIDYLYPPISFFNGYVYIQLLLTFKQIWIPKYTGFVEVTIESGRGKEKLAG